MTAKWVFFLLLVALALAAHPTKSRVLPTHKKAVGSSDDSDDDMDVSCYNYFNSISGSDGLGAGDCAGQNAKTYNKNSPISSTSGSGSSTTTNGNGNGAGAYAGDYNGAGLAGSGGGSGGQTSLMRNGARGGAAAGTGGLMSFMAPSATDASLDGDNGGFVINIPTTFP